MEDGNCQYFHSGIDSLQSINPIPLTLFLDLISLRIFSFLFCMFCGDCKTLQCERLIFVRPLTCSSIFIIPLDTIHKPVPRVFAFLLYNTLGSDPYERTLTYVVLQNLSLVAMDIDGLQASSDIYQLPKCSQCKNRSPVEYLHLDTWLIGCQHTSSTWWLRIANDVLRFRDNDDLTLMLCSNSCSWFVSSCTSAF